jgi:hypothetical protein
MCKWLFILCIFAFNGLSADCDDEGPSNCCAQGLKRVINFIGEQLLGPPMADCDESNAYQSKRGGLTKEEKIEIIKARLGNYI